MGDRWFYLLLSTLMLSCERLSEARLCTGKRKLRRPPAS